MHVNWSTLDTDGMLATPHVLSGATRVSALTRTLLSDAGYHVLEAENAETTIALAERHAAAIHLEPSRVSCNSALARG